MSILERSLIDTPLAIVDLETTGLSPHADRIIELAVVRIEPGKGPRLVLDTLVDPQRRVSASEIHGIYDEDVEGAPLFGELLAPLTAALEGAAVASFNVYFDMKFLENELRLAKQDVTLPHLCLMWLRPALGLGQRASLTRTCEALGVPFTASHQAATDAEASAALWPLYLNAARDKGVNTFAELAALKAYKFTKSWTRPVLNGGEIRAKPLGTALKPRLTRSELERTTGRRREWGAQDALAAYWEALTAALVDAVVSPAELSELRRLQASPLLKPEGIRYVHAKVMAGVLEEVSRDLQVDSAEVEWLTSVVGLLRDLGWSPGDPPFAAKANRPVSSAPSRVAAQPAQDQSWWRRLFS